MKYPIGIQEFDKIREGGYVYVDKTRQVFSLTHEGGVYFLGRPRRFGKSLLISTLENYYLGKKELFEGLDIYELETEWKTYPVFRIDFGQGNYADSGNLDQVLNMYLSKWEKAYHVGNTADTTSYSLRLGNILEAAHQQTGQRAVVLIDEYDKPMLDVMDLDIKVERSGELITLEQYNREVLRGLYTTFKAADKHLQFLMLTGVTKFSQVSMFSGFNQPNDISMSPRYDTICGITEEEMTEYFQEPIAEMAAIYRCTPQEMTARLKKQYDGYHFSDRLHGVFNPFSLLNAFENLRMQDYWFRTGTPTYLIRLLNHFGENIDEMTGRYYMQEQFIDYKANVDSPLSMIYQSGYFTIKDFDFESNSFMLDFPNDEVKRGFVSMLANNYLKPELADNSHPMPETRRDRTVPHAAHLIPGQHPLFHAQEGEREGARALLPLHLLSAAKAHQHLPHLHREGTEPGKSRLYRGDSPVYLHLRIQARRLSQRSPQTDRGERLCQRIRHRQPKALQDRLQLLVRERHHR